MQFYYNKVSKVTNNKSKIIRINKKRKLRKYIYMFINIYKIFPTVTIIVKNCEQFKLIQRCKESSYSNTLLVSFQRGKLPS